MTTTSALQVIENALVAQGMPVGLAAYFAPFLLDIDSIDTAAELLAQLLTVDGPSSGLDADLLDGFHGSSYLARANHTGTQLISTISDIYTSLEWTAAGNIAASNLTGIEDLDINKASGAATQVTVPLSTGRGGRPLEIKDKKRDASTNNITVFFTGGQTADGLSSIVISTDGGWLRIKPDASGWNIKGYQI